MLHPTRLGVLYFVLMVLFLTGSSASGQTENAPTAGARVDRSNLEVQLHLLLATNESADRNMPPALQPVILQLKSTIPSANYRLAATFTNRIRSGGSLEVKGVLPSEAISPVANTTIFYEFTLTQMRVAVDDSQSIEIPRLRFGMRVPIVMGMSRVDANTPANPSINYESLGLTTEISVRDGSPTVVGTMTTSKPDQLLVLVVTVKRTP